MVWLLLALVFAGIWVYALYREDLRNPEPVWMVLLAIGAGALAFPLAAWAEGRLLGPLDLVEVGLAERARISLFLIGPVEEGAKLLAVLLLVWPWTEFDEPVDGLVYAAGAGAGFALVENLVNMRDDPTLALSRGPAGTAAHVLFSALWGGALGHAGHLSRWKGPVLVAAGLGVAALAHGIFDLIAFSAGEELSLAEARAAQIGLFLFCLAFLRWRLKSALAEHPFRYRRGAAPAAQERAP